MTYTSVDEAAKAYIAAERKISAYTAQKEALADFIKATMTEPFEVTESGGTKTLKGNGWTAIWEKSETVVDEQAFTGTLFRVLAV